jgi:hypothetical protein
MNRSLSMALVLLLVLIGGGVLLTDAASADVPKKSDEPQTPPPPKSTTLAARPRALSRSVMAGLTYLAKQQQADGGWSGAELFPRIGFPPKPGAGPARPGAMPAVQTDVANTSIAALALLRAGYTPRQGNYSRNLQKAIAYVCSEIEKSDAKSLLVTDVKGTLVQTKIGPSVDTFLAALLLAEARGKMPDPKSEKRVTTALEKVVDKIQSNQKDNGTWGDAAWAPVLGQALASRALHRARQVGMLVDPEKLERTAKYARENFEKGKGSGRNDLVGAAGIALYATASGIGGLQDALNTARHAAASARDILNSPTATAAEKEKAKEQISRVGEIEKGFADATKAMATRTGDPMFIRGFGSDGGEEFLSFALVAEALRANDPKAWATWDRSITQRLTRSQALDGSWTGSHCISGRTFCTAAALLTLMADRAPVPVAEKTK